MSTGPIDLTDYLGDARAMIGGLRGSRSEAPGWADLTVMTATLLKALVTIERLERRVTELEEEATQPCR